MAKEYVACRNDQSGALVLNESDCDVWLEGLDESDVAAELSGSGSDRR